MGERRLAVGSNTSGPRQETIRSRIVKQLVIISNACERINALGMGMAPM